MVDPATAIGIFNAFKETYKLLNSESEDERVRKAVRDSIKEFKFFYEDTDWREATDEDKYQVLMDQTAGDLRKIAVKADEHVDEELVKKIRRMSTELQSFADKRLQTSLGRHTGKLIKEELEEPYQVSCEILEEIE